jgi:CDP-glucose 4,6-dehydratase
VTVDRKFWRGKSVFLTGHTGFKGGWLTVWLIDMGANVCGYALPPDTEPSYFALCDLERKVKSVVGDIRDGAALTRSIAAARPDIVFHLAAQPLVRRSYGQPAETFETNVLGTVNLLEAIRSTDSVKAVVVVTSDKCYENAEWPWGYRETDPLGGHDPYSASKACAEIVCAAYQRSFFEITKSSASIATVRAGNVIGGGDWSDDRIVPDAIKAFTRGIPLLVRNPSSVRPWQHVLEPLAGYLLLAQRLYHEGPSYAGTWNFGPHEENAVAVSRLADAVARHWGNRAVWRVEKSVSALHETNCLRLDCGKARALLGWRPRLPLDESVEMTVRWYRAATGQKVANMDEISCAQIHSYEQRVEFGTSKMA